MSLPALAALILDVLAPRADEDKYVNAPPENPGELWGRWRRDAQGAGRIGGSEERRNVEAAGWLAQY